MDNSFANEVENWVVELLNPSFCKSGFEWLTKWHQFRQMTPKGFNAFIFSISGYESAALMDAHLGIRIDAVEQIVFGYTDGVTGFKPNSMTLVVPLCRLFGKQMERFEITGKIAAQLSAKAMLHQFQEKGKAFFDQYGTLEALNLFYNSTPEQSIPLIHNQINRCFRGITISKLLQSNQFDNLTTTYRSVLEKRYAPQVTLDKFDRLVWILRGYSPN